MHFHERTTFGWVSCIGETGSTYPLCPKPRFQVSTVQWKMGGRQFRFFFCSTCLQPIFGMIQSTQNQIYCTRSAII